MKKFIFLASLALFLIYPFIGQYTLSLDALLDSTSTHWQIFFDIRLPRMVLAFFSGAILALGGLLFQAVFRNVLTTPFTLGVASGATFGAAFAIVVLPAALFALSRYFSVALFGFIGAMSSVAVLFFAAKHLKGFGTNSLLLVGIALSFFYSSALMVLYHLSDLEESFAIVRFTLGSLSVVGFQAPLFVALTALLLLLFALKRRLTIKLLLTSYENAFLKGVEVKRVNFTILLAVSLAVGITVSLIGPIGFVGLIIPHLIKRIYKKPIDAIIIPTFYYGGLFLLLCDGIARSLPSLSEVPIGVVTSLIGAPFFLYILLKRR